MTDQEPIQIVINHHGTGQTLNVPLFTGTLAAYPCFSALLHLDTQLDNRGDLNVYRFSPSFDVHFLWHSLLRHGTLPALLNFPPDSHSSFAATLELQAARMLLHACIALNVQIVISLKPTQQAPIIVKMINESRIEGNALRSTIVVDFQTHCMINRLAGHSSSTTEATAMQPSFTFDEPSRALLALWQSDGDYFANLEIPSQTLAGQLWLRKQRSESPATTKHTLEQHYLNAYVSQLDEIIIDDNFTTNKASDNPLIDRLIKAFAHIKCGVPFPVADLDKLIEESNKPELRYWHAFLLCYGHSIRAYSKNFSISAETKNLLAAQKIFKSLGDLNSTTRVLHAHASLMSQQKRFNHAIKLMNICINIRQFLHEDTGVARVLNGMAYVYLQSDQLAESLTSHQKAVTILENVTSYEELAFTHSLISWVNFLQGNYSQAVVDCQKTLSIMDQKDIHTLAFRTKPDLHAQLGICHFFNQQFELSLDHSNYCEAHKVDSSATGELLRTLLRGLINDHRGESHLADISFNYIPELIDENPEVDLHIEALFYRVLFQRLSLKKDAWNAENARQQGIAFCQKNNLVQTIKWFNKT